MKIFLRTMVVVLLFSLSACQHSNSVSKVPGTDDETVHQKPTPEKVEEFQPPDSYTSFASQWEEVQQFDSKGRPRSADKVVKNILSIAKKGENSPEVIKALIYQMKYEMQIGEKEISAIIDELMSEIKRSGFPTKQVLHSLTAQVLYTYFQQNRYKFYNRTQTAGAPGSDIASWDLRTIFSAIQKHYTASLESPENLQKIKINLFDAIISQGTKSRVLRPTLYDFLAHRTLDFLINDENQLTKPSFLFEIDDKKFFAPAAAFVSDKISSKEGDSTTLHGLLIFQQLTKSHLDDESPAALVDVELKRLFFVSRKTVLEEKRELYFAALKELQSTYKSHDIVAMVNYSLAQWYRERGAEWMPGNPKDEHQWSLKKAYEICENTVKEYPTTEGGDRCRVLMNTLTQKRLSLRSEKVHVSNKPFIANVLYKGVPKVYFRALKLTKKQRKIIEDNSMPHREKYRKLLGYKPEKEWVSSLPLDGDLREHTVAVKMEELEIGSYIIFGATSPSFAFEKEAVSWFFTDISNISFIHSTRVKNRTEIFVFDRDTGKPLVSAKVKISEQKYNYKRSRYDLKKRLSTKTDRKGRVVFTKSVRNQLIIEITNKKDYLKSRFYNNNSNYSRRSRDVSYFFTDRAIYRPGQTIHFKGIMLRLDKNQKPKILTRKSTKVQFLDRNRQKIAEMRLKSNRYGSFSGTFVAPSGVLNGYMTIQNNSGSHTINVEEYKRPKFETKFKQMKENFKIGDKVTVKGDAISYSGAPLTDAKVAFTVIRRTWFPYNWWSYWYRAYNNKTVVMENGEVKTDAKGVYSVAFVALADKSIPASAQPSFYYTVSATVTDINGETHSTTTFVNVGYTALSVSVDIPSTVDSQKKLNFTLNTTNLNGGFEPAKGSVKIWRISEPDRLLRSRKVGKPDRFVMKKEAFTKLFPHDIYKDEDDVSKRKKAEKSVDIPFATIKKAKKIEIGDVSGWKDGVYQLEIETKDRFGSKIHFKRNFTVFSSKPGGMTRKLYSSALLLEPTVEPGESAHLLLGSAAKEVSVIVDILRKGKNPERKRVVLDRSTNLLSIPIKESDRGGVGYRWMFQKNSRIFYGSGLISVRWSNKELKTKFITFRDKLKPGEKEEWRIKITGPKGEKVAAEMVASLYDASLDTFRSNSFYLSPFPYYNFKERWNTNDTNSIIHSQQIADHWNSYLSISSLYYDTLNLFGLNFYRRYPRKYKKSGGGGFGRGSVAPSSAPRTRSMRRASTVMAGEMKESESLADEEDSDKTLALNGEQKSGGYGRAELVGGSGTVGVIKKKEIKIRKNMQETAFFYPHLMTNKDGEIVVSFTVPEALTRWKMIGLAHTKDLKTASLTNYLITQKELMITPNVPRFLREMDRVFISTKISNLTDKKLTGKAELLLFNALNGKPIDAELKNVKREHGFSVAAKGNSAVSWELVIPEGIQAVTWRIIAKSENHSDGEESTIPVLSNRMMVTESLPLPINGNETKQFSFKKLIDSKSSKTLTNHRLTLEFTSNPVWYAVQSLPYLMEYPYECAEQIFSRYYANSLAAHIVNSNPRIKKVFDQWRGTDALLSNLQKNEELKSLLLQETPWVLDAQSEEQQKKQVALLFDLNKMSREMRKAHKKLKQMQGHNGGWPWFKGLPESRYISQHIVSGLGKLSLLMTKKEADDEMSKKAVRFIDYHMRKDYEWLVKHKVNMGKKHISYIIYHYLYTRSLFTHIPVAESDQKAFEYWLGQAEKYWVTERPYMKGLAAVSLHRFDKKEAAKEVIVSLREMAIYSEELGMYWKENMGGYYWYQAPIETQAVLIEAFEVVTKDVKTVDKMKTWLLKMKQVQNWGTTKATVDACYALLMGGSDWLKNSKDASIYLGGTLVEPKKMGVKTEAGTGHFKVAWSRGEIKPEMGNIKVVNPNSNPAWGALYWQYFEQLDKITPHETPLKLQKKIFKEKQTDRGPILEEVTEKMVLKPGDKLKVRIILKVDRDMEFIHMKDMRAAGTEPMNVISTHRYQDGLYYYESTKDAATNFFIERLNKGTFVFEYPLRVNLKGNFSAGITTIQCMYAPEFSSHSEGIRVEVR
ncbi:hypothetical protein KAH37_07010 [bacterium]|nr:hypothetical protein [bacterium]